MMFPRWVVLRSFLPPLRGAAVSLFGAFSFFLKEGSSLCRGDEGGSLLWVGLVLWWWMGLVFCVRNERERGRGRGPVFLGRGGRDRDVGSFWLTR